jgi:hypothetical protein
MRTIELIIHPDGSTKLETRGFQGSTCREADAFLRTALGQTTTDQPTAEYHAVPVENPPVTERPPA